MSLHEHHKRRMEQRINEFNDEIDQAIAGLSNLKLHAQNFLDNLPREQAQLKNWYLSRMKQLDEYIDMVVEFNLSVDNLGQINGVTSNTHNDKTHSNQLHTPVHEPRTQENQARLQATQAKQAIQTKQVFQAKLTAQVKQSNQAPLQNLSLTDQKILAESRIEQTGEDFIAFSSGSCSAESVKEIRSSEEREINGSHRGSVEGSTILELPQQPNLDDSVSTAFLSSADGVNIWLVTDLGKLMKLMEEMNQFYRNHKEIITYDMPEIGYYAYYDEETKSFMRAVYVKGEAEMTLVDTGDSIPFVSHHLRHLNSRFCSLPALAHLCHLADVDIPDNEELANKIAEYLDKYKWEQCRMELQLENNDIKIEDQGVYLYLEEDGTSLNEAVRRLISTKEPTPQNGPSQLLPRNGRPQPSQNGCSSHDEGRATPENWEDEISELDKELNTDGPEYENPLEAVTGYSNRDEYDICKHYKGGPERTCFKGARCKKRHVVHHPDGHTLDKVSAPARCRLLPLPAPGDSCKVKVTHVQHVTCFYVQFEDQDEPLMSLAELVTEMTREAPNVRPLKLEPALGELVAARFTDGCWYRARVTALPDQRGNTEVMYIDYGNDSTVPSASLRPLEARWLSCPVRATRCRLAGLSALSGAGRPDVVDSFSEMVLDRTFEAKVIERVYDELTVELIDREGFKVADLLAVTCGIPLEPYEVENDSSRLTCHIPA